MSGPAPPRGVVIEWLVVLALVGAVAVSPTRQTAQLAALSAGAWAALVGLRWLYAPIEGQLPPATPFAERLLRWLGIVVGCGFPSLALACLLGFPPLPQLLGMLAFVLGYAVLAAAPGARAWRARWPERAKLLRRSYDQVAIAGAISPPLFFIPPLTAILAIHATLGAAAIGLAGLLVEPIRELPLERGRQAGAQATLLITALQGVLLHGQILLLFGLRLLDRSWFLPATEERGSNDNPAPRHLPADAR